MGFLKKKFSDFSNFANYSMFVGEWDRNSRNSQNVQILIFCKGKIGFSEKKLDFLKTLNVASSLGMATKLVKRLITFESWVVFF